MSTHKKPDVAKIDAFLLHLKVALEVRTDKEVAGFLGISPEAMGNWRSRGIPQNVEDLVRIKFKGRGVDVNWLLAGEEKKEAPQPDTAEAFVQRVEMMQRWADYLDRLKNPGGHGGS